MSKVWYTARNTYNPDFTADFSWQNYIEWTKLTQLKELVSLDGMLNELAFEPDFGSEEDWEFIITDGDYITNLYSSSEYVLNKTKDKPYFNYLSVIKNPSEDSSKLIDKDFEFVGYELLDEEYGVSALTNCGGFDETFRPYELNQYGLIDSFYRALQIQKDLRINNPQEHHAYCNLFGVWRHKEIGRKGKYR